MAERSPRPGVILHAGAVRLMRDQQRNQETLADAWVALHHVRFVAREVGKPPPAIGALFHLTQPTNAGPMLLARRLRLLIVAVCLLLLLVATPFARFAIVAHTFPMIFFLCIRGFGKV